ncbi:MAG: hypothetical protein ACI9CA_001121 [Natronomonas sp.]|jgi:hypothetical protein
MVSDADRLAVAVLLVSVPVFLGSSATLDSALLAQPATLLRRASFISVVVSGGYLAAKYLLNPAGW